MQLAVDVHASNRSARDQSLSDHKAKSSRSCLVASEKGAAGERKAINSRRCFYYNLAPDAPLH